MQTPKSQNAMSAALDPLCDTVRLLDTTVGAPLATCTDWLGLP